MPTPHRLKIRRINPAIFGGVRYTLRDDFSAALAAGSVNGTAAVPGPGNRVVVDTNTKISITGGALSFATGAAANDGLWLDAVARSAGKLLVAKLTIADTNGIPAIGWDTNQSGAINDALKFTTTTGIQVVPNGGTAVTVGAYTATTYYVAGVQRATGIYWFVKGGAYTNWALLWFTAAGNATVYPGIQAQNTTTIFTSDFLRVPAATWLPTPDAYDTFTRSDGSLGSTETTGPDGQSATARTWTGATFTVSSNKAINTPNLGSDLISNGTMEDGDPPTGWTAQGTPTTFERSAVQAHGGTYSLHFVTDAASEGARQTIVASVGTWMKYTAWVYRVSGTYITQALHHGIFVSTSQIPNATWTQIKVVGRITNANTITVSSLTTVSEWYVDDVVLQPLTLSELFSSITASTADVIADVNVTLNSTTTERFPTGLVVRLDSASSPANFIIAYIGTDASAAPAAKLDKCVAGTYTSLISAGITYSAGAQLRVIANGTSVSLFYNGAQVGTTQTVSDAGILNNTLHGMFATDSVNTLDAFSVFPYGNAGEHNALNRYTA